MTTARRYPPNRQLTWERLERGWSHDELCEQIKNSMCDGGEADTGLTGNTVRRWETGERWPDSRFRKHLVTNWPHDPTRPNPLTHWRDC